MEFDNSIYEQIEAFISGEMGEDDKKLFEVKIQSDKDLEKEVELHRSLKNVIQDKEWHLTENVKDNKEFNQIKNSRRSKKYANIEASIQEAGDQYFENEIKPKGNKKWLYYISAVAAVICIAFFINYYNNNQSTTSLYAEYSNWKELPSLTIQDDNENILAEGEHLFFEAEYTKAIMIFSQELGDSSVQKQNLNPYILSYLGASYLELNDYENAILTFDQLLNSNTVDSSKGYWYKAMVYLKQGNKQKTEEQLKLVLQDERNFNFQKAVELYEKLDFN